MSNGHRKLDMVLDDDQEALFRGTPEEIVDWFEKNDWALGSMVYLAEENRLVEVPEYIEGHGKK